MASVRTRRARPSAAIPDDEVFATLPAKVASVFNQVQHSVAVHRKHQVPLSELHKRCADIVAQRSDGSPRLVGEKAFIEAFLSSLNRVLGIKRGEAVAERCIRFAASYTAYAQDAFRPTDAGDDYDETPAERFSEKLLKHLLRGFGAKDKNVRFRCVELVALLVSGLSAIDDNMFVLLKSLLKERIFDKEAPVRVHAVIALGTLQGPGDPDGEDEEAEEVRSTLLWLLRHDPNAEVRRAVLFNLAKTQDNLQFILERMRDVDTLTRRSVFMPHLSNLPPESWVGTSTRDAPVDGVVLDGTMTNKLILEGLKDRETPVQVATKRLLGTWVSQSNNDLVAFLNHFDLLAVETQHLVDEEDEVCAQMVQLDPSRSGLAVGEHALRVLFEAQPTLTEHVALIGQEADQSDTVWANLTPATALMAKAALEHWRAHNNLRQFDNAMPAVTALAFRIQKHFNDMLDAADQVVAAEEEGVDDNTVAAKLLIQKSEEAVVHILMQIVQMADYGDEIGRRKVFGLVREMMSDDKALILSEALLADCLDLLAKLADSQADLVRIVVEITQQLEEEEDEEDEAEVENETLLRAAPDSSSLAPKQRKSVPPQDPLAQRNRTICRLVMVRLMLERVGGHSSAALTNVLGSTLYGLQRNLIVPAVRSKDPLSVWHGYRALGLCALLNKPMAERSFGLLLSQLEDTENPEPIRVCCGSIVFDLILVHGLSSLVQEALKQTPGANPVIGQSDIQVGCEQVFQTLKVLLEDDSLRVQATAALGISKFLLAGVLDVDPALVQEALKSMVLVYMAPYSTDNIKMQQCLSYFLPAYCYSSRSNQRGLRSVWLELMSNLIQVFKEDEPDPDAPPMLTPHQIALQLVDWMDASKAVYPGTKDFGLNLDVLSDVLREILVDRQDERKLYMSLLSKVHLPNEVPDQAAEESVHVALVLSDIIGSTTAWQVALNHDRIRPASLFDTAVQKNAFARFHSSLHNKYEDQRQTLDVTRILAPVVTEQDDEGEEEEEEDLEEKEAAKASIQAAIHSVAYQELRDLLAQTGADVPALIDALGSGGGGAQEADAAPSRSTRTKTLSTKATPEPRLPSSRYTTTTHRAVSGTSSRSVSTMSRATTPEAEEKEQEEQEEDEEIEDATPPSSSSRRTTATRFSALATTASRSSTRSSTRPSSTRSSTATRWSTRTSSSRVQYAKDDGEEDEEESEDDFDAML